MAPQASQIAPWLRRDVVVGDEQAERDQRERGGDDQHAAAQPARIQPDGWAQGGEGDQHRGQRPRGVEQRVLLVGLDRHLVEVDPVADGPHREGRRQQPPRRAALTPGEDQDGDHEREHHQVAERIGEVRGDGGERPLGAGDDAEHERGADGGAGQRADEAVEPQRARELVRAGPQQQHQAGERRREDAQVAGVGERRVRRRGVVGERRRPVDVTGGDAQQAEREGRPRGAFAPGRAVRPQRADRGREQLGAVVGVLPDGLQPGRHDAEVAQHDGAEADERRDEQPPLRSPCTQRHRPLKIGATARVFTPSISR